MRHVVCVSLVSLLGDDVLAVVHVLLLSALELTHHLHLTVVN